MSYYSKFAANVLFPLHERLKRHKTIEVFHSMEKSQWLSPEKLQELQTERLRLFLTEIGQRVPFYRELFSSLSFKPREITSVAQLQDLPLMGKPEIRENLDRLKADGAVSLQRFNTGGSTGEPLVFFLGKERVSHDVAAKRRATRWWNVDIGDREIVVWGSPIELGAQDRVRLLRDKLLRTSLLPAFAMSDENLDRFIATIQHEKPKMLFGYPSALSLIAQRAMKTKQPLSGLGIDVVFVTSEMVYDHQRKIMEEVFGCPVANGYGGRDAGFIAHQCPQGSMHITAEDIIVEIVNEAGKVVPTGHKGEIVTTHLATSEFPFLRYRTGDVGSISSEACACGRGLPVLAEIEGRTTDFIRTADGTVLHGLALIYVLRDIEELASFKIIQETVNVIRLQLVAPNGNRAALEKNITGQFKQRLGDQLELSFEYLPEIQREKSGKFRYVVSHVE